MTDKKKGLKRAQAPVDLYTLKPEPDILPTSEVQEETTQTVEKKPEKKPATKPKDKSEKKETLPEQKRIKTSVEFLPETIELLEKIKSQHRRKHRRLLPIWKIIHDAISEYAEDKLK